MTIILLRRGRSIKAAHAQGKAVRGLSEKAALSKTESL